MLPRELHQKDQNLVVAAANVKLYMLQTKKSSCEFLWYLKDNV